MPTLSYQVVDVFTDRAYAGNPLAVVLDAEDLDTGGCQALAREFNLSETAFCLQPTAPGADYRLRIFTPQVELPFAGHPSVGAAWVLGRLGRIPPGDAVQECGAGLVPVTVAADGGPVRLGGGPPHRGPDLDPAPLLAAVGLVAADLADGGPVRTAGTGIDFAYLPVHPDAVARAVPDPGRLASLDELRGLAGVSVVALAGADPLRAHARVFAGAVGVTEDPATGSAALGLGVWLVATGRVAGDGTTAYVVRQGAEVGRPSLLDCTVTGAGGAVVATSVAGSVVPVARGEIVRPAR